MTDDIKAEVAEPTDLIAQAKGRAAFLRDRGEVKTPDLLEALAARLAEVEAERDATRREVGSLTAMLAARLAEYTERLAELEDDRDDAALSEKHYHERAETAEAAGIERAAVWLESVPQVLPDRQELASAIRKLKHTKDHPST